MLIGIVGFIGSGKGTAGDYLTHDYGYIQDSFARSLKDGVAVTFGWDREMLEGATNESRIWREKVDVFWSKVCGFQLSPRLALQLYGTECMRENFHDDIWAMTVIKRYNEGGKKDTVITDCRFRNEINKIKKAGGYVIRVKRGPEPEWYDEYMSLLNDQNWYKIGQLRDSGVIPHISETNWIGSEFDFELKNDKTLVYLYHDIGEIIDRIKSKTGRD